MPVAATPIVPTPEGKRPESGSWSGWVSTAVIVGVRSPASSSLYQPASLRSAGTSSVEVGAETSMWKVPALVKVLSATSVLVAVSTVRPSPRAGRPDSVPRAAPASGVPVTISLIELAPVPMTCSDATPELMNGSSGPSGSSGSVVLVVTGGGRWYHPVALASAWAVPEASVATSGPWTFGSVRSSRTMNSRSLSVFDARSAER